MSESWHDEPVHVRPSLVVGAAGCGHASPPVRVLIADQAAVIRAGLRSLLSSVAEIEVVGEAENGLAALEEARRLRPDVLLAEVRPDTMGGPDVARLLASTAPPDGLAVVVMADRGDAAEALKAGASGAVAKDAPLEQIVTALRVAAVHGVFMTTSVLDQLIERSRPSSSPGPTALDTLTERELSVLRLIASGLSNAEIAAHLRLAEPTVKTHVRNLFRKLRLRNRAEAAALAHRTGLETGHDRLVKLSDWTDD
jgi:DNA-binding NarL/FixJ family response regulator